MSTISQNVSRRSLVAGALAGAWALAAGFVCRPALAADDVKFDDECEVLVVGSGYAGLAAAYEAAKAGARSPAVLLAPNAQQTTARAGHYILASP